MVKGMKQCLKQAMRRSTLDCDELQTPLIEIKAIVNARSLTYIYDDEEAVTTPLTPSHMINGRRVTLTPGNQHFEIISVNNTLTRRGKHHQPLLQQFNSRWRLEYLLNLRERASERLKRKNKKSLISIGDIVIVKSDLTKRLFWKLAKVEGLFHGRDGQIRLAN